MKVLIFGNSGSGKSTYAQALVVRQGLPHLDLDSIVWEPGQIAVQRAPESITTSLRNFISSHADWVIEGCYGELAQAASTHCTQLIFLNPGLEACHANNIKRTWEPHKYASLEQQNPCSPTCRHGWPGTISGRTRGLINHIGRSSTHSLAQSSSTVSHISTRSDDPFKPIIQANTES
jgi:energy-coupling factor transporter ATP-binding protein EcfA2